MSSSPIKKVIVVGGSGLTGAEIVRHLLRANFDVSVLSRASSNAPVPEGAKVIKTDYSHNSLVDAFKCQDAVVSAMATFHLDQQFPVIDAAAEAGVRRFIPSEYGVDTSGPAITKLVPLTGLKRDTIERLKTKQSTGMSWTGLIVGAFFDSIFDMPGILGVNMAGKTITVYDGGDVPFEATNLAQIGRAVTAILSAEHLDETANRYIYINSFTISQNQMLKTFQDLSGNAFEVNHAKKQEAQTVAEEKMRAGPSDEEAFGRGNYEGIVLLMLNHGGFCEFSKTKGLWNDKLGLPHENVDETLEKVLASKGLVK
ncbi:hypothetical protein LTR10_022563 [Elasticomyces elasticus]|uniref:NmrA-like domain-containing protein n=1 Tax=Exophiala sideris TaxID=1016849 RepID=A0ABR0J5U3_9EURO|nr:hypothetical protein LTR10_022563 [Elasticomyces elasticus]KAK5023530.1 hypothetical protein LTR13_011171 [Exophiala sideris]KAK5028666.1 hypothetical protein LTS07_006045 [Exophiala sideris]KAK5057170.1 hypothetical protein LTR69_007209 [Exophiala sideris]KAK5181857.1 hypothetical protein LTR44_006057 [Eurotiomycetes sp. CCFEE 6388]